MSKLKIKYHKGIKSVFIPFDIYDALIKAVYDNLIKSEKEKYKSDMIKLLRKFYIVDLHQIALPTELYKVMIKDKLEETI